jgi:methionyl-tRNA synthetase
MAKACEHFLNSPPLTPDTIQTPLLNHTIATFIPLMRRVDQADIDALVSENQQATT